MLAKPRVALRFVILLIHATAIAWSWISDAVEVFAPLHDLTNRRKALRVQFTIVLVINKKLRCACVRARSCCKNSIIYIKIIIRLHFVTLSEVFSHIFKFKKRTEGHRVA